MLDALRQQYPGLSTLDSSCGAPAPRMSKPKLFPIEEPRARANAHPRRVMTGKNGIRIKVTIYRYMYMYIYIYLIFYVVFILKYIIYIYVSFGF